MPSVIISDFSGGIDTRRTPNTSSANRFVQLKDCFITAGKTIRARPGFSLDNTLEAGTRGLFSANGVLNTFYATTAAVTHANANYRANRVAHPVGPGAGVNVAADSTYDILFVHFVDLYNGYLFVIVEYVNGDVYAHYLDSDTAWAAATAYTVGTIRRPVTANGFRYKVTAIAGTGTSAAGEPAWPLTVGSTVVDNPGPNQVTWTCQSTYIEDTNCPRNQKSAVKLASKIFMSNGETVRFCATNGGAVTNGARDWTTASNAGFLSAGTNQPGSTTVTALGAYYSKLVVFFADGSQVWNVDPDPSKMSLFQVVQGAGCIYPRSVYSVGGDCYYMSRAGFKSISVTGFQNNLAEYDVGSPIDRLVKASLPASTHYPVAIYYPYGGQYWCVLDYTNPTVGTYVYSSSKTAKVAAWSQYIVAMESVTIKDGVLYYRTRSTSNTSQINVNYLPAEGSTGTGVNPTIEFSFLTASTPGIMKMWKGFEMVGKDLSCTVSFAYSYGNQSVGNAAATTISGTTGTWDMSATDIMPMELMAVSVKPTISITGGSAVFELESITLHYDELGPV